MCVCIISIYAYLSIYFDRYIYVCSVRYSKPMPDIEALMQVREEEEACVCV